MKIIEIEDNKLILFSVKLFQIIMRLSYIHHLKKFIKDNYAIKLKYF